VVVAAAVAVALVGALAVDAATRRPPTLMVRPAVVARGDTVAIRGTAPGCAPANTVFLISRVFPTHAFGGAESIATPLRPGARFSVRFRVPPTIRRGRYLIGVRCGGGNVGIARWLTVR
jgi:hypothetical protein